MLEKESVKIELIINKLEKLIYSLKGKNYDFTKFLASDNTIDDFILKLNYFEEEKNKQDKMKDKVKEVISFDIKNYFEQLVNNSDQRKVFDDYFEDSIRVEDFGNYYILWLYGIPSFNVNFVFDKNGKLIFDNKNVYGIDSDNFFAFEYDVKENSDKLYHYQWRDSKIKLVNVLDNVVDVDYSDFFGKDLVVCCCGENRMLYNYKNNEIVIPSYSSSHSDIGKFGELVENDGHYIRLVKQIFGIDNYNSVLISNLEFLVDKNGKVCSSVCDFENDYECRYLFPYVGKTQGEVLNSVYKDAMKICNLYKKVKRTK